MSERGTLVLEPVVFEGNWAALERNTDRINDHEIGRGPAQARVYNSANIGTTSDSTAVLTFNSERWDTGNFHSTATNTSRLTAPTAGLYMIGGHVAFATNGTDYREVRIRLNGTTHLASQATGAGVSIDPTRMSVTTTYQLAAGDYVELTVVQSSGGALDVIAEGNNSPEFWIVRLGSQA